MTVMAVRTGRPLIGEAPGVRVPLRLEPALLDEVDRALDLGEDRSKFIREAVRRELARRSSSGRE